MNYIASKSSRWSFSRPILLTSKQLPIRRKRKLWWWNARIKISTKDEQRFSSSKLSVSKCWRWSICIKHVKWSSKKIQWKQSEYMRSCMMTRCSKMSSTRSRFSSWSSIPKLLLVLSKYISRRMTSKNPSFKHGYSKNSCTTGSSHRGRWWHHESNYSRCRYAIMSNSNPKL